MDGHLNENKYYLDNLFNNNISKQIQISLKNNLFYMRDRY